MHIIGTQTSEPVGPDTAEIDYVPTQYVAEVIQAAGYDSIAYGGALAARGRNVVLFDPDAARVRSTSLVRVTQAHYTNVPVVP